VEVRRGALIAVAVAALSIGAGGCGEKEEPGHGNSERIDLLLDFYPNPDHAGIYVAQQRGYFGDAGLRVEITEPSDPASVIKLVATGRVDLAISYEPEVILARDRGLDVVAVAALVDEPLTSMVWLPDSGIGDVGDLGGRTIATAGIAYQDAFLRPILSGAGVNPDEVKVVGVALGLLPAILSRRADALLGAFSNVEGVDLRLRGENPTVIPVDQLGVPPYDELVLVAGGERLRDDPEAIRLFIAALARGTAVAVSDPREATRAVLEANPDLDPRFTRAEIAATLPLLAAGEEHPFGYMDPEQWRNFSGWMRDHGEIEGLPEPDDLLTNEQLPAGVPD
jgi:putative hydroxymethylpyrimidine transport system substrate-binding protein